MQKQDYQYSTKESLIVSTAKRLKSDFYISLLGTAIVYALCKMADLPPNMIQAPISLHLQQVLILAIMGGLPGILIWAKNKMKTLADIADLDVRLNVYRKYALIRQSVFFVLVYFALFVYFFTGIKSALMLLGVVVCLCIFILPTKSRLEAEAHLLEAEEDSDGESELEK